MHSEEQFMCDSNVQLEPQAGMKKRKHLSSMFHIFSFFGIPQLISAIILLSTFLPGMLSAREVRVGVFQNPPKVIIDESGKPAGIFIDILEYVAEQEDWKLTYVPGTWEENLSRLEIGEIDLLPDVAFTAERDKKFSFHKIPVLSAWSQVYSRKGLIIQSIADLTGKRIAVLEGSVQQSSLKAMVRGFDLQARTIPVTSFDAAFTAVAQNKADAAVTNNYFGNRQAKNYGLEDTGIVFDPATLFFATTEALNPDLLAAVDKHLEKLKQTPLSVYYTSLKRWTSEDIGYKLPTWIKVLIMVICMALGFSFIAAFVLKRQVAIRTLELRTINHEMEKRIDERTAELAKATKQAQEADVLKSAFLATMSHELRTPLNSIIGFTGILLQEIPGPMNAEQKKQLGMVQNSSRHLLSLINDILDISKIEAGQLDIYYQEFDLKEALEKVKNIILPQVEKKLLNFELELAGNVGTIKTDRRRLEQVVINLLSNAMKFTEQGNIFLGCKLIRGFYQITVRDTGIGIPDSEKDNLFTPFRQIDTGLTRRYEGTGLGLSISYQLVKMMGGSISFESIIGVGTSFIVSIPACREEAL